MRPRAGATRTVAMTRSGTMTVAQATLTGAVAELRATADDLDQARLRLHRSFSEFLGGGWTGRAADSFGSGWDDWSTGVAEVCEALRSIADLVQVHGHRLHELDAGVGDEVVLVLARLGRLGRAC